MSDAEDYAKYQGTGVKEAAQAASAALGLPLEQLHVNVTRREANDVEIAAGPHAAGLASAYGDETAATVHILAGLLQAVGVAQKPEPQLKPFTLSFDLGEHEPLLRNRGASLKDLQFLVNYYHRARFPQSPLEVTLEAGSSRDKRDEEVVQAALQACAHLSEEGDSVTLEPMNSYERRLVHLGLQQQPHLKTLSVGDGSLKCVKIVFQKAEKVDD